MTKKLLLSCEDDYDVLIIINDSQMTDNKYHNHQNNTGDMIQDMLIIMIELIR